MQTRSSLFCPQPFSVLLSTCQLRRAAKICSPYTTPTPLSSTTLIRYAQCAPCSLLQPPPTALRQERPWNSCLCFCLPLLDSTISWVKCCRASCSRLSDCWHMCKRSGGCYHHADMLWHFRFDEVRVPISLPSVCNSGARTSDEALAPTLPCLKGARRRRSLKIGGQIGLYVENIYYI